MGCLSVDLPAALHVADVLLFLCGIPAVPTTQTSVMSEDQEVCVCVLQIKLKILL